MSKPAFDAQHPDRAIDVRFGQVGLAQVRIRTTDPGAILDELTGRVASAPQFFDRTAVCVDLSALDQTPEVAELRAVFDAIRRAGMLCVGLTQGPEAVEALARALDVPVIAQIRAQRPGATVTAAAPAPAGGKESAAREPAKGKEKVVEIGDAASPSSSMLHQQPIRSGQRVYARQRDLIVTATVGAGAEVMADGCVHIYGALRGRVMAGVRGDTAARVFCQSFNAELVSIAGVFRVFETIPKELAGRPVQASLDGEDLNFTALGD